MAIRRHRVEIDRLKNAQDEQRRLLDARAAQEQQERSARESSAGSSDATTLSGGAIGKGTLFSTSQSKRVRVIVAASKQPPPAFCKIIKSADSKE